MSPARRETPGKYRRIEGSELRPGPAMELHGEADPDEMVQVTIVLRRRPGGPDVPGLDHYATTPPARRRRLPQEEFARQYGAADDDLAAVRRFAEAQGLTVAESSAARRTVVASGTIAQLSQAFAVTLRNYRRQVRLRARDLEPSTEIFRSYEGYLSVPEELADIVIGVFGLDNRRISKRAAADPPGTGLLSVTEVRALYDFPPDLAASQTIAIFSEAGYLPSDISDNFGGSPPIVVDVPVDAPNDGSTDGETTQDICIAGAAAPGAEIAVYFTTYDQLGWVDLVKRVVHPSPGDPVCSVLSSSFYVSNGDDAATLAAEGIPLSWVTAVTQAFEDAAIQDVTVCIASGDFGSGSRVGDGRAHVQYPSSDPWVLAVGGTTIGNVSATGFDEYAWNDTFTLGGPPVHTATGGGVSDLFGRPAYQVDAGVPGSVNDGHQGRGVPDVAGNASVNSGYPLILGGSLALFPMNGTSSSTPLWAGLIAVFNAALGENVGFVNPVLYALGSSFFRDIVPEPGAADNSVDAPGYPVTAGWDACTGWGSPRGQLLLSGLRRFFGPVIEINLPGDLSFGVTCGPEEFRTLQVFNTGTDDLMVLSITQVSGSADFSLLPAPALPLAIAPGGEVDFTVRFGPTTRGVPESATFQIVSDDPVTPVIDLVASGQGGTGALETVIAHLGEFGDCPRGSFADLGLTLHNNGPCRLSVEEITSSSAEFQVPSVISYPLVLAPGGSVTVPVRFRPTVLGAASAAITVTSDDPVGPKVVHVSGHAPAGEIVVTGSTWFGGVPACGEAERTVTIGNLGRGDLHVSKAGFRHESPHWRLVNDPFPRRLPPGSCLSVCLRYRAEERHPRSCDLVITSDDPRSPVTMVEVTAWTVWDDPCDRCGRDTCRCRGPRREPCDPCDPRERRAG